MSQLSFANAGMLFSTIADRARGMMDGRIRSADDAARAADMRVIASIPQMPSRKNESARALVSHYDPNSETAAAFRRIAAGMIQFSSILLTSSGDGEGRSVCAANIATALSQTGRNTILLDADFEVPMQHQFFGMQNGRGLADVLSTEGMIDFSIQSTDLPSLSLLTAGSEPVGSISLPAWMRILKHLSARFDHVVIDGPSLPNSPGTVALAMRADATLTVARAGRTRGSSIQQMCELLRRARAHLPGIIFNGA